MRVKNTKTSDKILTHCVMDSYTEDASEIKMPLFIHSSIVDAQNKAVSPNLRANGQDGYVYVLSVEDATYDEINQTLSVLESGKIMILEIITMSKDKDGHPKRLDRITFQ